MMGKVQCDSLSFEEFYSQHPNETKIMPTLKGFDSTLVYQLSLTSVITILTELIIYISQKVIDSGREKGTATFVYEDGFKFEVSLSKFKNPKKIMNEINVAHDIFLKTKEMIV